MIPLSQKKIVFENSSGCIVDELELEKAILYFSKDNLKSKRKIYLFGEYAGVTLNSKKVHVHRLLMMFWMGRKLKFSEHCDHINGNKLDNHRDNLRILDASKHISRHRSGKKLTAEHKKNIALAGKKRKGMKYNKTKN